MPRQTPNAKGVKHKELPRKTSRSAAARRVQEPRYRSFRLSKRVRSSRPKVKGAFRLFGYSVKVVFKNWKLFGGIMLVYLALLVVLVRGINSFGGFSDTKDAAMSLFTDGVGKAVASIVLLGTLVSSGSSLDASASVYQSFLLILISLVLIWALRQTLVNAKVGIRDAFYNGMYPLTQFVLVLLVVLLQLTPFVAVNFLYNTVFGGDMAATVVEKVLWALLLGLLALWSLYMVSSSVFALYVVTLPDMRPMKALRSVRGLVRFRRWMVLRKVVFLPLALLVIGVSIMLPVIIFVSGIAEWLFFVLTILGLIIAHSYMYNLYRELIKDEQS